MNTSTLSGAMSEGLLVTVTGLVIVFSVLIILMLLLMGMKAVFYKDSTATKVEVKENNNVMPAVATTRNKSESIDDEELIAVLTAAVAASLNTSTYNLQIKSYRRIGNNSPAWNKAGVEETINNRF